MRAVLVGPVFLKTQVWQNACRYLWCTHGCAEEHDLHPLEVMVQATILPRKHAHDTLQSIAQRNH